MHQSYFKPSLQYSLGSISLHCVIHSHQERSVHPLPFIVVLALRPLSALRGFTGTNIYAYMAMPYAALHPFTVRPSCLKSFYCPPQSVALAVTSGRASLLFLCRLAFQCGQVCHTAMLLFAAGAITF